MKYKFKVGQRVNYNLLRFKWRADYGFTSGIYMGKTKSGKLKVADYERLGLMKLDADMVRPYNPRYKGMSKKSFYKMLRKKQK